MILVETLGQMTLAIPVVVVVVRVLLVRRIVPQESLRWGRLMQTAVGEGLSVGSVAKGGHEGAMPGKGRATPNGRQG